MSYSQKKAKALAKIAEKKALAIEPVPERQGHGRIEPVENFHAFMKTAKVLNIGAHPDLQGKNGYCLAACELAVQRHGGQVVLGWGIQHHKGIYMLFAHAVWKDDRGRMYDLTMRHDLLPCRFVVSSEVQRFYSSTSGHVAKPIPNRYFPYNEAGQKAAEAIAYSDSIEDDDAIAYWTNRATTMLAQQ